MTTEEAVALRKRLELDMLATLQAYRDATGLSPTRVDVLCLEVQTCAGERSIALTGVRVTVEV